METFRAAISSLDSVNVGWIGIFGAWLKQAFTLSSLLPFIVANHYSIWTVGSQTSHNNNRKQQRLLEYKILAFQFCPLMIFSFVITLSKFTQHLCASLFTTQNGLPCKDVMRSHFPRYSVLCFLLSSFPDPGSQGRMDVRRDSISNPWHWTWMQILPLTHTT